MKKRNGNVMPYKLRQTMKKIKNKFFTALKNEEKENDLTVSQHQNDCRIYRIQTYSSDE